MDEEELPGVDPAMFADDDSPPESRERYHRVSESTHKSRFVVKRASTAQALQLPTIAPRRTSKRHLTVARRIRPGEVLRSLDASQKLEVSLTSNPAVFLRSQQQPVPLSLLVREHGPRFDDSGSPVAHSLLGLTPAEYIQIAAEKQQKFGVAPRPSSVPSSISSTDHRTSSRATRHDNHPKRQLSASRLEPLPGDVPANLANSLSRQERALQTWERTNRDWERTQKQLISASGRTNIEDAAMESGNDYRLIREELELVERNNFIQSPMSHDPLFQQPVEYPGSRVHGIYLDPLKTRKSPVEIVRRPGGRSKPTTGSSYFRERSAEVAINMKDLPTEIDRSEFSGLEVVGTKVPLIDEEDVIDVEPEFEEPAASDSGADESRVDEALVACNSDTESSRERRGIKLDLDCTRLVLETEVGELGRKVMRAFNSGSSAVHFDWRPRRKDSGLPTTWNDTSCSFYFNDLKGIILPNEYRVFEVMFKSLTPGIFFSSWELWTSPRVPMSSFGLEDSDESQLPRLVVKGVAIQKDNNQLQREEIRKELRRKQILHCCEGVLWDIVRKIEPKPVVPPCPPTARELRRKFADVNRDMPVFFTGERLAVFRELAARAQCLNRDVPPAVQPSQSQELTSIETPLVASSLPTVTQARKARGGKLPRRMSNRDFTIPIAPVPDESGSPTGPEADHCSDGVEREERDVKPEEACAWSIRSLENAAGSISDFQEREQFSNDLSSIINMASVPPYPDTSFLWLILRHLIGKLVERIPDVFSKYRRSMVMEEKVFAAPVQDPTNVRTMAVWLEKLCPKKQEPDKSENAESLTPEELARKARRARKQRRRGDTPRSEIPPFVQDETKPRPVTPKATPLSKEQDPSSKADTSLKPARTRRRRLSSVPAVQVDVEEEDAAEVLRKHMAELHQRVQATVKQLFLDEVLDPFCDQASTCWNMAYELCQVPTVDQIPRVVIVQETPEPTEEEVPLRKPGRRDPTGRTRGREDRGRERAARRTSGVVPAHR